MSATVQVDPRATKPEPSANKPVTMEAPLHDLRPGDRVKFLRSPWDGFRDYSHGVQVDDIYTVSALEGRYLIRLEEVPTLVFGYPRFEKTITPNA